ncbi:MAG TPA: phosphoribosylanthranilate isomerase [Candidatus Nitrosotalea sp.]|nr:phosphoribosylanthranilate isomerase [Candidatus Nitrosotalea sp.]
MPVRVKICGITNVEDALDAAGAGADALGFMFYAASPRNVSITTAADIIRRLPPFIAVVGVFVNATEDMIRKTATECRLDVLQFHGDETPEFCLRFPQWRVCKSFRVQSAESLSSLTAYRTDAWLLDGFAAGKRGGTGTRFDWNLAVEARKLDRPIVLAGGLTPENVADAVCFVQPYAVDVSSGVEASIGKKDRRKVREFIAAAKEV